MGGHVVEAAQPDQRSTPGAMQGVFRPRARAFSGCPPSGLSALNDHVRWTDLVGQEERAVASRPHAVTRFQTPRPLLACSLSGADENVAH